MADSDAILLVGSISPAYMASKLFNCVLSKNPVLSLFHEKSLLSQIASEFPNVRLASFKEDPSEPEFESAVDGAIQWLHRAKRLPETFDFSVQRYSAEQLTKAQCRVFDSVVAKQAS